MPKDFEDVEDEAANAEKAQKLGPAIWAASKSMDDLEDKNPETPKGSQTVPPEDIPSGPPNPASGPPTFNPEEEPKRIIEELGRGEAGPSPETGPSAEAEHGASPAPICLRCIETVEVCKCPEGPDEG